MDRTYRGLPVVGGDLVVHQAPGGSLERVSQTLDGAAAACATMPRLSTPAPQPSGHLAPTKANRAISTVRRRTGTPRLVVDATVPPPRLAWEVAQRRHRIRRHPEPAGDVRRRHAPARSCAASRRSRPSTGSGQSLYSGTVPLQVTQSGVDATSSRTRPAATPTRPT